MTSLRLHYRASAKAGRHAGSLFIRVIHRRRIKNVSVGFSIYSEEWDADNRQLIYPADDNSRASYLRRANEAIIYNMDELRKSVSSLRNSGDFTVEDIIKDSGRTDSMDSLRGYALRVCRRLLSGGQERTARAYLSSVRSLEAFIPDQEIRLRDINHSLIQGYEQYLLERGLMMNTVSFYMRNLRAIYYRAVKDSLLERGNDNPFENVFTGLYQTRRRSLDRHELNSLASLESTLCQKYGNGKQSDNVRMETLRRSLSYFMFCYHARGMSFVDLAYLRKQDIGKESILYKRRKTGGYLEVKITRPMRSILNYFRRLNPDSAFVFPIMDESRGRLRLQYESGLRLQNKHLKELSSLAGINKNLTTHVSRHTWATLAKWSKVHITLISEALGHRDIKTTQTYLASFERSTLDELSVKLSGFVKAA